MPDIGVVKLDRQRVTLLTIVAILAVAFSYKGFIEPFWDYEVYKTAIDCFVGGCDPYAFEANGLLFVYPPLFLRLFSVFSFPETYSVCLALMAAVTFFAMRDLRAHASFALLGFLTGGAGLRAALTGNFTTLAHSSIIALAYAAYRAEKSALAPAALAIAILVFSALKFYFLAYAVIFLLLPRRRATLFLALPVGIALAIYAQMTLDHDLWAAFSAALYKQTLANGDLGFTLFSVAQHRFGNLPGALALHEAVVLAMLALAILGRCRNESTAPHLRTESELFYVLAALILLNPRLKDYDFAAFMVCVYLSVSLSTRRHGLIDGFFTYAMPLAAIFGVVVLNFGPALGLPIAAPYASVYFLAAYASFLLASIRSWPLPLGGSVGGGRALDRSAGVRARI